MVDRLTSTVIRSALTYIAEEMGIVLKRAAFSPNIRDRLDYSCVIATPDGLLVAQAEHIPVHLGSMAFGVRETVKAVGGLDEGDVVIVNDPYIAGTHLNDVMLVKPVYVDCRLVALVACKAHHVDVGGRFPGGFGPARSLYEEGVVIEPVKLVKRGVLDERLLEEIASKTRMPRVFKADILAQLSSLRVGEARVRELAQKYGVSVFLESLEEAIEYVWRYTRSRLRELLDAYPQARGRHQAVDYIELPDGRLAAIRVEVTLDYDRVVVDFAGSSRQVGYPLNAVYGVTLAASTYALKTIIDPDMPVNHGFYRLVEIRAPRGTIVNPVKPAPVAAGNVETSQRIVDVIHLALSEALPGLVPAASCGTMSNVVLAGRDWVFYETVGCGSGARPGSDGVDGVHVNMTNTLNTPIEVIEAEYPVRVEEYRLRENSGGIGRYRGGLGIVRVYRALEKMKATVLITRRRTRPWGLEGGQPGAPARAYVVRADRRIEEAEAMVVLQPGDRLVVETPGGGGYGDPCARDAKLIEKDAIEEKIDPRVYEVYCGQRSPVASHNEQWKG